MYVFGNFDDVYIFLIKLNVVVLYIMLCKMIG